MGTSREKAIEFDLVAARTRWEQVRMFNPTQRRVADESLAIIAALEAERDLRQEAEALLPSLMSFALAAPTNPSSEAARNRAVTDARAFLARSGETDNG